MRTFLIAAVVVMALTPSALAQTPADTPQALTDVYACAQTQDDVQRLQCYDGAVGRLRQAETQGQVVAIDRARADTLRRESFGFTLPNLARLIPGAGGDAPVEHLELTVERVAGHATGRRSFIMSNGQVWTQVEPRNASNVRPGDRVTIRQAALGSFLLVPEHGPAHRVRRQS